MDEELDIVTFSDDDGNEYDMEVIDYFVYEDVTYALLVDPTAAEDEDAEVEVYIMKTETEGDETVFLPADEDKMDALIEIAERHMGELRDEMEADAAKCACGCGCEHDECEHEHGADCDCGEDGCGCGHAIEDGEYDDGKPGFCSGE